ncbi:hypothetical protein [Ammoniphilus resinae]|uniref:Uncharacterized protein n=1 Tax=Ammoniphilus resinae TaxID=861532 RepID=A0ABS4GNW5_9BACL|nr:hypothetical protein [Ammoniphilus resinae]MBP1931963.1 hypothetical protein [Ammoniphilus resinae]
MDSPLQYTRKEEINDIRSNIIDVLVRLFKNLDDVGAEVHIPYERYYLHYVPRKGMWVDGCLDRVFVKDYRYASVSLGDKITAYGHVPFTWLKSLVNGQGTP